MLLTKWNTNWVREQHNENMQDLKFFRNHYNIYNQEIPNTKTVGYHSDLVPAIQVPGPVSYTMGFAMSLQLNTQFIESLLDITCENEKKMKKSSKYTAWIIFFLQFIFGHPKSPPFVSVEQDCDLKELKELQALAVL